MSKYTPPQHAGASLFFTIRLADRNSSLLVDNITQLREAMRLTRDRYPFEIAEITVLPSVIHTIWQLPQGDTDFSTRWRMLKAQFVRRLPTTPVVGAADSKDKSIWQRRFWEHTLRDQEDIEAHRQMIFSAPVQAGLVAEAPDWPYSSIHRAICNGSYERQSNSGPTQLPFVAQQPPAAAPVHPA